MVVVYDLRLAMPEEPMRALGFSALSISCALSTAMTNGR
jgi:hypothetical protein